MTRDIKPFFQHGNLYNIFLVQKEHFHYDGPSAMKNHFIHCENHTTKWETYLIIDKLI